MDVQVRLKQREATRKATATGASRITAISNTQTRSLTRSNNGRERTDVWSETFLFCLLRSKSGGVDLKKIHFERAQISCGCCFVHTFPTNSLPKMALSLMERTRAYHEDLEHFETALIQLLMDEHKTVCLFYTHICS